MTYYLTTYQASTFDGPFVPYRFSMTYYLTTYQASTFDGPFVPYRFSTTSYLTTYQASASDSTIIFALFKTDSRTTVLVVDRWFSSHSESSHVALELLLLNFASRRQKSRLP